MARNFSQRMAKTGRLQGTKAFVIAGDPLPAETHALAILLNAVTGSILYRPVQSVEAAIHEFLKVPKGGGANLNSYKARPLNGIWATAPYLHNGSVPNLWQLLQSPEQRVKEFYVGTRAFDPKNVGFETQPFEGGFRFDTTLPGNSNEGHVYGTQLADEQKWELIEYLKSL
jgi:hypothetical protein